MKIENKDRAAILMDRLIRMGVPREKLQPAIDWLLDGRSKHNLPKSMRDLRRKK